MTSDNGRREALDLHIGLLRAGEVLTIEDLLITTADGREPHIEGVVQQAGKVRPLQVEARARAIAR